MEELTILNRLQIIQEYLKCKDPNLETLKIIVNEKKDSHLLTNLLNCLSSYINKFDIENAPDKAYIVNIRKIIIEILNKNEIKNLDSYLGKIRKAKKQSLVLEDKIKSSNKYAIFKDLLEEVHISISKIEKKILFNVKNEYKDNNYELLKFIIHNVKNTNYLNHILHMYPYYINTKDEDGKHIIIDIIDIFKEEILKMSTNNMDKVSYYEMVINKFISNARFKVSDDDLNQIKRSLNDCINTLNSRKKNIRKYTQKNASLINIYEKLNFDKSYVESIESLNKRYGVKTGFDILIKKEIDSIKDTKPLIITIDDEDTLDMDDAIQIVKNDETYTISIFITDIPSLIKPKSNLDIEAYRRFSTKYLSDMIIPMFPFELSNDILSLNSNGPKKVITYELEVDKYGEVINSNISSRVIRITNKLSYDKVNKILVEDKIRDMFLYETLQNFSEVALALRKRNQPKNSYREIEDLSMILHGKKINNEYNNRTKAEIIIEELMILGNSISAEYCSKKGLPYCYRVLPKIEKTENYEKLLQIQKNLKKENINIANEEYFKMINELVNIYPKATYSINNIGHAGINKDYYSHSTSPIRRYPDVTAQRLTHDLILQEPTNKKIKYWTNVLEELCPRFNEQEVAAENYQKEYEKILRKER